MHALIPAPSDPSQWQAWREQIYRWRDSTRALLNYDDSLYAAPEFAWIPRTFTLGFLMLCDQLFYDGDYRLDAYLDHGEHEFGGYDALILWHAYPRIGFDARNQFDFYRDMPGGLPRLRQLVDECHARGVRVYIDYNPWDTGTRREGRSDTDALVDLVAALDADAIFLDTMSSAAGGLRAKLDAIRPGTSLESEIVMPLERIDTHPSSWAQGFEDAPGVLRNKWFERRHMQHRIRRWQRDHTSELHTAWMNGTGAVVWENVFGSNLAWSERDKSILRSMVGIQRHFADLFSSPDTTWTPLVETLNPFVQASLWEAGKLRLWTLVNTREETVSGDLLAVADHPKAVYSAALDGKMFSPRVVEGQATLWGTIPPRGITAFLAIPMPEKGTGLHFLSQFRETFTRQAELDARANFDPTPPVAVEVLRPAPTAPHTAAPDGMVAVPVPATQLDLPVTFTVRECGFYDIPGADYPSLRYENLHRPLTFTRTVALTPYAIDLTPVTNRQFADFLAASGYAPAHPENFLAHWRNGSIPPGTDDHPVVYVGLEDARAYAAWAGKRLPREEEWQYAAQGGEAKLRYPWGDEWQYERCNNGEYGSTTPVMRFPAGRSPFGVYDMCGNVWEWTESERSDGRARFAILKGGSYYRAIGSEWYADGGAQANDFAAKFLLMYPGLDRCATIGFRCAVDLG